MDLNIFIYSIDPVNAIGGDVNSSRYFLDWAEEAL